MHRFGARLSVDRQSFLVPLDDLVRSDALRREAPLWTGIQHLAVNVRTLVLLTLVLAVHLYLGLHSRTRPHTSYSTQVFQQAAAPVAIVD